MRSGLWNTACFRHTYISLRFIPDPVIYISISGNLAAFSMQTFALACFHQTAGNIDLRIEMLASMGGSRFEAVWVSGPAIALTQPSSGVGIRSIDNRRRG